jgi:hypothetical protein
VPSTTFSVIRSGKKLIQSGSLVKRYFTVDEYAMDIDQSQVLSDFVWGAMKFTMAPNGIITFDPSGIGTGQMSGLTPAASPSLTAPIATTSLPLAVVDATLLIGTGVGASDSIDLTSLDVTLDISPMSPDVFGSGQIKYGPDVFAGQMGIAVNFSCLQRDLQFLQDFAAETQYAIHLLAVENTAEPKNFFSMFMGNLTLGSVTRSAYSNQGGPRTQPSPSPWRSSDATRPAPRMTRPWSSFNQRRLNDFLNARGLTTPQEFP